MNVKAFEIVPIIENVDLPSERSNSKVQSIECCGSELFIGTDDSFILKYYVEEIPSLDGKLEYNCRRKVTKLIDLKKPVLILKAASALNKLIVLCDTTLMILTSDTLEPVGQRRKNTSTFCVNEDPSIADPFCMQICVGTIGKKQVSVYNVTLDEKLVSVTTISGLPGPPKLLVADCGAVCAALDTQYVMLHVHTNTVQELFPYGSDEFNPLACRVTKGEFLLSAQGGLGMFVTSSGTTNRPPLMWSYPLEGLTYHHPYIIGMSSDVIMVHSVLDQQQKQALPLVGGLSIGNYEGRVYVSRATSIMSLCPVPWEIQVKVLLADGRVEEALSLTDKAGRGRVETDQARRSVQNQAAFIYFSRLEMERAQELFMEGNIDERELISLFPGLLAASSNFVRAVPPLHNIADVAQLFGGDSEKIATAKQFLLHFLQMAYHSNTCEHALEVDTALVKLLADMGLHSELVALLRSPRLDCDMKDCAAWLEQKGLYYALGLLHRRAGSVERLLRIWSRIVLGEVRDPHFPGLEHFADALAEVSDPDLIWKYADLVLQRDEETGSKVFASSSLDQNTVLQHLQQYPQALITYLENLVLVKKVQEEKYHTRLAVQYLDRVVQLKSNLASTIEEVDRARSALRSFLENSNFYRSQFLLPRVRDAGLKEETAIMYGKIGDHEKALNILAHQLKDFGSAEAYCLRNSTSADGPNNLLHVLLNTYLNPSLGEREHDEFLVPTLELLSKHAGKLDPMRVLEIIPSHWSLGILDTFLRSTLRKSLHKHRISKIECALAKGDNLRQEYLLSLLKRHSVRLLEQNYCCVCKKPFSDASFARYPNDILTHVECARLKNVCPVTGHLFTSLSARNPGR